MRRLLAGLGLAIAVAVTAGCGTAGSPAGQAAPAGGSPGPASGGPNSAAPAPPVQVDGKPGPKPTRWPAATAGGACQLLDYGTVQEKTGTSFDVAAGGQQDATYTCVLQNTGRTVPDLSLAVTPTTADPTIFRNTVMPKGAAVLTGLGKVGYRANVPAVIKSGRGPGVEIGWLSANNRILVLRYTMPGDAAAPAVEDTALKLFELAKAVDQASV